jgi:DNA-binding MarR family transcriptional regulator
MSPRAGIIPDLVSDILAFAAAVDLFDQAAGRALGLSRTDLKCAQALAEGEGSTPAEIAERTGRSADAVAGALARLEEGGYVVRRGKLVALTPDARARIAEIYAPIEVAGTTLHRYGAEELATVKRFLRSARTVYEREAARVGQG